jgi:hypothetical protein
MAKVIKLKKDESIKELKAKLKNAQKNMMGIDAKKYSGVIKLKEDPVKYQKKMRNEWE